MVGLTARSLHATVSGPRNLHFGLRELRGVRIVVHENGTVGVFVDTAKRHGFRVMLLAAPTRLVVDFAS